MRFRTILTKNKYKLGEYNIYGNLGTQYIMEFTTFYPKIFTPSDMPILIIPYFLITII